MALKEGDNNWLQDFVDVPISIQVAINDQQFSTVSASDPAPNHDGSATEMRPFNDTAVGVSLSPSTVDSHPSVRAVEAKATLICEQHPVPLLESISEAPATPLQARNPVTRLQDWPDSRTPSCQSGGAEPVPDGLRVDGAITGEESRSFHRCSSSVPEVGVDDPAILSCRG